MWRKVRNWFNPRLVYRVGATPDYRFSLANERTFLAWIRTGLGLIAAGLAVAQFLNPLPVRHLSEALAIVPIALGAFCALRAVNHWIACELAMRQGKPLPESRFPATLAIVVVLSAVLAIGYVVVDAAR